MTNFFPWHHIKSYVEMGQFFLWILKYFHSRKMLGFLFTWSREELGMRLSHASEHPKGKTATKFIDLSRCRCRNVARQWIQLTPYLLYSWIFYSRQTCRCGRMTISVVRVWRCTRSISPAPSSVTHSRQLQSECGGLSSKNFFFNFFLYFFPCIKFLSNWPEDNKEKWLICLDPRQKDMGSEWDPL